jgi:hypothetical protein
MMEYVTVGNFDWETSEEGITYKLIRRWGNIKVDLAPTGV